MAEDGPRCPLGFKGTPPAGHPSIPGFNQKADPQVVPVVADPTSWNPKHWSPQTLIIVDVVFLVACVAIAFYLPNIKSALGSGSGTKSGIPAKNQSAPQ
ncbi:unnamed protein product [Sympodiomycopsis kandeliae]